MADKPKTGLGVVTGAGIAIILAGIGYATAHKPHGHPGPFPTLTHSTAHTPSPTAKHSTKHH